MVGLKPVQELLHIADFLKDNEIKGEHIGLSLAAFSLVAMVLVSLVTSNGPQDSQTQQNGE